MFNIMILGCKKTLVEYRGWVNRNRYYLRNPIRMGGLFSQNDFVQRLTRPEYFLIATSPKNPTTPPFLSLSSKPYISPIPNKPHFPTPFPPQKSIPPPNQTPKLPPFPPISPTLSPSPTLLSTLFPKTTQFTHKFH